MPHISLRYCALLFILIVSCREASSPVLVYKQADTPTSHSADSAIYTAALAPSGDTITIKKTGSIKNTTLPDSIVAFAKTLMGTPYKFGCAAPETGFDCSGFITYVFNHFNITVPRSSVDFTNEGTTVTIDKAMPGDLILFTGTNSRIRTVGHIGLVIANDNGNISFIQSSSGKDFSVIISPLEGYYMTRFVKVIRIIK